MPYGTPDVIIINGTPIVGGTPGEILFVGAGNVIDEDPGLFWDDTNKQLLLGNGSQTAPSYSFASEPTTGVFKGTGATEIAFTSNGTARAAIRTSSFVLASGQLFGWSSVSSPMNQNADTVLTRDAANTLAQRNGTTAQTHRIYNTFTSSTNFERGFMRWSTNVFQFGTEAQTGTSRNMELISPSTTSISIKPAGSNGWSFDANVNLIAADDNQRDIGATGATRPRSLFLGTSIQIEANNGLKLTTQTDGAGANAGTLLNAPTAGDPAFWLPVTINGNNRFIPCWA